MFILGLNVYHGDSSACIFRDGELICAFEEERFTRIKHWLAFLPGQYNNVLMKLELVSNRWTISPYRATLKSISPKRYCTH